MRSKKYRFRAIPDGLPDDHPRSSKNVVDLLPAISNTMVPLLKRMVVEEDLLANAGRRPVTCFVADGVFGFACDFAAENGFPVVYFRTSGATNFWAYFQVEGLIEAQEIPVGGNYVGKNGEKEIWFS